MTEAQIKHMVDRFLSWRLPQPWRPDGGISYTPPDLPPEVLANHPPVGTNLFDAGQTTAMVRHMIEGIPAATETVFAHVDALPRFLMFRDLRRHFARDLCVSLATHLVKNGVQPEMAQWVFRELSMAASELDGSGPRPIGTDANG